MIFLIIICIIVLCIKLAADNYITQNQQDLIDTNQNIINMIRKLQHEISDEERKFNRYADTLDLTKIHNCSSSIVANAEQQKVKYLMKYSGINNTTDCLEKLDYCDKFLKDCPLLYSKLQSNISVLSDDLSSQIPKWVLLFNQINKIIFNLTGVSTKNNYFNQPHFTFLYISPAGKSRKECKIYITSDLIKQIRSELYADMSKSQFSKAQRNAMTNDLREAIKKQDNYTCRKCGNSVFKEPNLLLEVDHIIPVSKGGRTEAKNLQTLCWRCNRSKSNK